MTGLAPVIYVITYEGIPLNLHPKFKLCLADHVENEKLIYKYCIYSNSSKKESAMWLKSMIVYFVNGLNVERNKFRITEYIPL